MIQSIKTEQPLTIIIKLANGYQPAFTTLALWSALNQIKSKHLLLDILKEYIAMKVKEIIPEDQTFHVCPAI